MNILGIGMEAGYALILLIIVVAYVLGWKPKLSPRKIGFIGGALIVSNLVLLAVLKEQGMYNRMFFYVLVPLFLMGIAYKPLSNTMMVFLAGWMWLFLEFGIVHNNYVTIFLLAVVLIPAFQCWRNPKEEGFIRTDENHWNMMVGALCFFLSCLVFAPAFGWETIMVTKYAKVHQWMLPISLALFFFAKAIPEELVFRGVLQGALKDRWGVAPAIISSAMLYGVAALNNPAPWTFPNWHAAGNALVLGLACGIVYHKTKSLAVSGMLNALVSFLWWMMFAHGGY